MNLREKFEELLLKDVSAHNGRFPVSQCLSDPNVFLGVTSQGTPAVFIEVQAGSGVPRTYRLANLHIELLSTCTLVRSDGTESKGVFSTIECLNPISEVQDIFLGACELSVAGLPKEPFVLDVQYAVDRLLELFRLLGLPPKKTALGLWGELFLVYRLPKRHRGRALERWHVDPMWLHDFGEGTSRVEVKTTLNARRKHKFSLAQLCPPPNGDLVVASIITAETPSGLSLRAMYDDLRSGLGPRSGLVTHLDQVLLGVLGSGAPEAMPLAFDEHLARATLKFFDYRSVPQVSATYPKEVSDVRFTSDLTDVSSGLVPSGDFFLLLCS